MATLITLILMLTIAIPLFALPTAKADGTMKTYAFIGATPNPIGVGQETLLHIGITQQLYVIGQGWTGVTVTVTKPDGTTQTIGPLRTDSTGGTGYVFIPSMVGNYTLQTHFPEQKIPSSQSAGYGIGIPANTTILASDSAPLTLIVTEEQRVFYPGIPLPTEYWTRPINSQFREWYSIAGSSWVDNEYNEAPNSPHILWAKPLTIGGLVGGDLGLVGSGGTSVGFENGDAYEGKWSGSLILAGRLYYQDAPGRGFGGSGAVGSPMLYHCVDLRTGEEYWTKTFLDNRSISFGQLYYWESYNFQGTFAYLWVTSGTTWTAFDAFTGDYRATITNVPSGTRIMGPRGEVYLYSVNQNAGYMTLWNMSALVSMAGSFGSSFMGQTFNATATNSTGYPTTAVRRAWAWNITIPKGLVGSVRAVALNDRVVGVNQNYTDVNIWAFSLKKGQEGALLFNNDWKAPADWSEGNQTLSWVTTDLTTNVGLVWSKETRQHYAFSLETGQYLWVTEPEHYLDIYSAGRRIYDGILYSVGQAGIVYAFDLQTGKTLWTYPTNDPYNQVLWSNNWPLDILFGQGGKLYLFHSEHSANQPLPRGAPAVCLNATTGDVIWRVDGLFRKTDWGGSPIMGDSVIAMYNTYDQQVYAIGKGPSATTVAAPDIGVPSGNSIVIKGTVTDVSPGITDYGITARFPNGVPAISDDSMGEWMKYVYAQFPRPTNATGVPVSIDIVDSNGNYRNIGSTTSDSSGAFSYQWTPDIPGKYTVIATFAGSESYWPSYSETSFAVDPAAATPTPIQQISLPPTEMYFAASTAAIIVAIAIVGVMLALMLKRRTIAKQ